MEAHSQDHDRSINDEHLADATNVDKYLTILRPRARFLLAEVRGVHLNSIYDVAIPLAGKECVFYSLLSPALYLKNNITDYDYDLFRSPSLITITISTEH